MNENEKNNEKQLLDIFENFLSLISKGLSVIALLMTGVLFACQFLKYLFYIQLFNYWTIDYSFYSNNVDIVNSLLYSFCIVCILLLLFLTINAVKNSNQNIFKKLKLWIMVFILYAICFMLTSLKELFKFEFNIIDAIIYIIVLVGLFIILVFFIKKQENKYLENKKNNYVNFSLKTLLINILSIIVAFFMTTILLGIFHPIFNKDYRIINNDTNQCNVILYSAKDYYIIAECEINENELTIYKNTQKKIDNYNVIAKWETFEKIKKS